ASAPSAKRLASISVLPPLRGDEVTTITFFMSAPSVAERGILRVAHLFQPLVGGIFAGNFDGYVRKPAVLLCAVPMLYFGRNYHHVAGVQRLCGFAPLLIPAAARNA